MKHQVICTTLLVEKSPQALPLGAACVASAIKNWPQTKELCEVSLVSFSLEDDFFCSADTDEKKADIIFENLKNRIKKVSDNQNENVPVILFSTFVWNQKIFTKVSQKFRGIAVTIAGGPEITAHPQYFSSFDYVVSGEGESTVPELVHKLITNPSVKANKVIFPKQSCNPQELTSPYLDGTLDPEEYGGVLWELARGCPFKCSYCYESKGEKSVRLFPMERIESELKLFAQKKVPQVFVLDPTYNANKKRAVDMINLIARYTPDTFYYFEARGEFIDRELARAFTKIPCALQIGLQSADENVLKLVNRPFNKKAFVRNLGFLNEEGVVFGLDLIYGLPGENFRGFKDGVDFAVGLYPNNLEIFRLSVLPGTDLYERAEELHLTFEPEAPYHIIHTNLFSKDDLLKAEHIGESCSYFYNQGRAVPWFNTICRSLKMKPSVFFDRFTAPASKGYEESHQEIEKNQIAFITQLYHQQHGEKYLKAAVDLIRLNGALSRTLDTGKGEIVQLSYNAEYLASQYSTDLNYFVSNVRPKPCKVQTFKKNGYSDFKIIK